VRYYGLTLGLRADAGVLAQYREHHRNPWPEPLAGLRRVGVRQMRIFLLGRRLFMYMETTDDFDLIEGLAQYMRENPRAVEWDRLMRAFQEPVADAAEGEWWAAMEPIFDLEEYLGAP